MESPGVHRQALDAFFAGTVAVAIAHAKQLLHELAVNIGDVPFRALQWKKPHSVNREAFFGRGANYVIPVVLTLGS